MGEATCTTDVDSSVKVMISDYIVQILQGVQEINVDNMEMFLDNNEIIIDDFDENGNFEINQEAIANIIYNFQIIRWTRCISMAIAKTGNDFFV